MSENGLRKAERLCGRNAISEVMNSSKRGFVYPLRYAFVPSEAEVSAVLFAVPKKGHKKAVERNLIRRRMREAYRLNKAMSGEKSANIALFYSSSKVHNFETIQNAVQKILTAIGQNL